MSTSGKTDIFNPLTYNDSSNGCVSMLLALAIVLLVTTTLILVTLLVANTDLKPVDPITTPSSSTPDSRTPIQWGKTCPPPRLCPICGETVPMESENVHRHQPPISPNTISKNRDEGTTSQTPENGDHLHFFG